jgi:hypothetical protein
VDAVPYREPPPPADRKAISLRVSEKVHAALRKWADDELRSLNGQIEHVLHDALVRAGRIKPEP